MDRERLSRRVAARRQADTVMDLAVEMVEQLQTDLEMQQAFFDQLRLRLDALTPAPPVIVSAPGRGRMTDQESRAFEQQEVVPFGKYQGCPIRDVDL